MKPSSTANWRLSTSCWRSSSGRRKRPDFSGPPFPRQLQGIEKTRLRGAARRRVKLRLSDQREAKFPEQGNAREAARVDLSHHGLEPKKAGRNLQGRGRGLRHKALALERRPEPIADTSHF